MKASVTLLIPTRLVAVARNSRSRTFGTIVLLSALVRRRVHVSDNSKGAPSSLFVAVNI